jgi:hypothetical protein
MSEPRHDRIHAASPDRLRTDPVMVVREIVNSAVSAFDRVVIWVAFVLTVISPKRTRSYTNLGRPAAWSAAAFARQATTDQGWSGGQKDSQEKEISVGCARSQISHRSHVHSTLSLNSGW